MGIGARGYRGGGVEPERCTWRADPTLIKMQSEDQVGTAPRRMGRSVQGEETRALERPLQDPLRTLRLGRQSICPWHPFGHTSEHHPDLRYEIRQGCHARDVLGGTLACLACPAGLATWDGPRSASQASAPPFLRSHQPSRMDGAPRDRLPHSHRLCPLATTRPITGCSRRAMVCGAGSSSSSSSSSSSAPPLRGEMRRRKAIAPSLNLRPTPGCLLPALCLGQLALSRVRPVSLAHPDSASQRREIYMALSMDVQTRKDMAETQTQ